MQVPFIAPYLSDRSGYSYFAQAGVHTIFRDYRHESEITGWTVPIQNRVYPTISTENPLFLRSAYHGLEKPTNPSSIRVMSFNVLCPEYAMSNLARERLY